MTSESNSPQTVESPSARIGKAQRHLARRFAGSLVCLAGIALLVWYLPSLVGRTALRQEVPKLLFPFFQGKVEIGETSLGWTSPVVVRDVRVADRAGEPMLKIGEIRSKSTLWELATSATSLGRFDLLGLSAQVVSTSKGTNFDQTIANFRQAPRSPQPRAFELICERALIALKAGPAAESQNLPLIDAHLRFGMDEPNRIAVEVTAREIDRETSTLTVRTESQIGGSGPMEFFIKAQHWQLAQFTPLLRQWADAGQISGEINGAAKFTCDLAAPARWSYDGDLKLTELELRDWQSFQGDDLHLELLAIRGQLAADNQLLRCNTLKIESDAAELNAHGLLSVPNWQPVVNTDATPVGLPIVALVDQDFRLSGWIDGAVLAEQLPRKLQLRKGTKITDGRLVWEVVSKKVDGERTWIGHADMSRLIADVNGQSWNWDSPIDAVVQLKWSPHGLVFDQVSIDSEFLQAKGQGTAADAEFKASADLDHLSRQLSAIIDLEDFHIAGAMTLHARVNGRDQDRVEIEAKTNWERLTLGNPKQPLVAEPQLDATFHVVGSGPANAPWQSLESGAITLVAGNDRLQADLLHAVHWQAEDTRVPLKLEITGDLGHWQHRLRPFAGEDVGQFQGQGQLAATVHWSRHETVINDATFSASPLRWATSGWNIDEPGLSVQSDGTWSAATQTWSTPQTSVLASFGSVNWEQGQYSGASPRPLSGSVRFDVDLGRISRWQSGQVEHHVLGTARGIAECREVQDQLELAVDASLENLTLVGLEPVAVAAATNPVAAVHWAAQWKEPQLSVRTQARYNTTERRWEVRELNVAGDGIAFAAAARTKVSGDMILFDTRGQLDYDWSRLSTRLDPETSRKLQLAGSGSKPFWLRGQWRWGEEPQVQEVAAIEGNQLSGEFGIGWESARLLGLSLGPAEIKAQFQGDKGAIQPLDMNVAEGRVHLAPQFRFQPSPAVVMLPSGRVLDQVRLSPELCRDSLKYVTPMIADATQVDGRFSLDLTQAAWPLGNSGAGTASGDLLIHGAQVRPGPLVAKIMGTVEQVRALVQKRAPRAEVSERVIVELPEQTVRFSQANERVSHDRFVMKIRDVEIQTRGSVGMDESLNLVASIPLREDWISDERMRQALGGQTLQVPIYGTLKDPQIDPRAFGELARRAAGSAVERLLDGRVKDRLQRLLPQ